MIFGTTLITPFIRPSLFHAGMRTYTESSNQISNFPITVICQYILNFIQWESFFC